MGAETAGGSTLRGEQSRSEVFGQPRSPVRAVSSQPAVDPLNNAGRPSPSTSQGAPAGISVPVRQLGTSQGPPVGDSVPFAQSNTSQGAPDGLLSTPFAAQHAPVAAQDASPDRPRLRSARFSDTNLVRTYSSQELLERDPSISDFARLELLVQFDEEASSLKEHDGPAVVSGLVDCLIRTLFNDQPHTSSQLSALIGPERCAEISEHSFEIGKRFDELVARLLALEHGQTYGLLPSNSKLTKHHTVWIQALALWVANDIAVPRKVAKKTQPSRKHAQKRRMCGICGARVVEARD